MPKFETQTNQLSLINGVRTPTSDFIAVSEPRTIFAPEARKGRLYMVMEVEQGHDRDHTVSHLVARTVRSVFFEDSSFSITSSLKAAIRAANKALYQHNFGLSTNKRTTIGITCAVIKESDLFIAQVVPAQAYALTGGQVRALPTPPAWHSAHISASPFLQGGALGTSLFVDPELYRCTIRPGDSVALCSSTLTRLLSQKHLKTFLEQQDAPEVIEQFHALCLEHEITSAHVLAISLQVHRASVSGVVSRTPAARSTTTRMLQSVGGWFTNVLGTQTSGQQSATTQRADDTTARPPDTHHTADDAVVPAGADPMGRLPAQPSHSAQPVPRPRSIDTGQSLDELHANAEPTRQFRPQRRSLFVSPGVPSGVRYRSEPADDQSAHTGDVIDLSHLPDIEATREVNKPPYRPRHKRRPMVDMPLHERLLVPFRYIGAELSQMTARSSGSGMKLESLPPVRGEGLSYLRRGPAFPWMTFVVFGLLIAVLILYGLNLSSQSARERADEDLTLAEQRIATILEAPDHATALDRLENARQAIDQIRNSAMITETNAALWLRYQELQNEYEEAVSSVQRLTFFREPQVLAEHPLPTGRFASIVVPPSTSSVTSTYALEALQFLYALDVDRANAALYRIPRQGGTPEPYLTSNQAVQNVQVQTVRAISWRVDNIVAIDQGPNASGYYFRNGATWNHTRLGGSEIWLPGNRLDMETYQGNLYVWGAEPGEILRFASGHYGDPPMLWIDPAGLEEYDLSVAVDMAVDGVIYLLQPDGTILVLNAGRFERAIIPESISPPITTPTRFFVTGGPDDGAIFLLEPLNKRIIQIDKATGHVIQQMMAHPEAAVDLDQLTDLYVDTTSVRPLIYLINGRQLVMVELPNPPAPFTPPDGTIAPPGATP